MPGPGPASAPIRIRGARQHNLRSLDLDLPSGGITLLVGVSGSGKSSLLLDTLLVEGQRRYFEALSGRHAAPLARPDVDLIDGLPPTVSVTRRASRPSPRETLGTLTEVDHLLRVLVARLGQAHCPGCRQPVQQLTPQEIQDRILASPPGTRLQLGAPLRRGPPGGADAVAQARALGFVRLRLQDQVVDIDQVETVPEGSTPQVIVDRLILRESEDLRTRLADSVEVALQAGDGIAFALMQPAGAGEQEHWFSQHLTCPTCNLELPSVTPTLLAHDHATGACPTCQGLGLDRDGGECPECDGCGLGPVPRLVSWQGRTVPELLRLRPEALRGWLEGVTEAGSRQVILERVRREVVRRTHYLERVGLGYLTFQRRATTLASGELARAALATHCGAGLAGVLYCLDEPTGGLHPRDTDELVRVLTDLREAGNTLVVASHDPRILAAADHVVELGPGAGREGGEIVYQGSPGGLPGALTPTGHALGGPAGPGRVRRPSTGGSVTLHGVRQRNLQDLEVAFPLGQLVVVCGPSGAGKSTLVEEVLEPALASGAVTFSGGAHLDRVVRVDPARAPRNERSVPATVLGIMHPLRDLYAATRGARVRGWGRERFSFNRRGGRCAACAGKGTRRVGLELLPEAVLVCEVCGGSRFDRQTLEVRFRGLSIARTLSLTIEEARELFTRFTKVERPLTMAAEVGLGYLVLGQPVLTLSGGERQRLRLAAELCRTRDLEGTLYLLDEPTLGLHQQDILGLLGLLDRLLDAGASVIAVDHSITLLRAADHLIELGPGGGPEGGRLLATGTPEDLHASPASVTAPYL